MPDGGVPARPAAGRVACPGAAGPRPGPSRVPGTGAAAGSGRRRPAPRTEQGPLAGPRQRLLGRRPPPCARRAPGRASAATWVASWASSADALLPARGPAARPEVDVAAHGDRVGAGARGRRASASRVGRAPASGRRPARPRGAAGRGHRRDRAVVVRASAPAPPPAPGLARPSGERRARVRSAPAGAVRPGRAAPGPGARNGSGAAGRSARTVRSARGRVSVRSNRAPRTSATCSVRRSATASGAAQASRARQRGQRGGGPAPSSRRPQRHHRLRRVGHGVRPPSPASRSVRRLRSLPAAVAQSAPELRGDLGHPALSLRRGRGSAPRRGSSGRAVRERPPPGGPGPGGSPLSPQQWHLHLVCSDPQCGQVTASTRRGQAVDPVVEVLQVREVLGEQAFDDARR